jgi:hypothetical protein
MSDFVNSFLEPASELENLARAFINTSSPHDRVELKRRIETHRRTLDRLLNRAVVIGVPLPPPGIPCGLPPGVNSWMEWEHDLRYAIADLVEACGGMAVSAFQLAPEPPGFGADEDKMREWNEGRSRAFAALADHRSALEDARNRLWRKGEEIRSFPAPPAEPAPRPNQPPAAGAATSPATAATPAPAALPPSDPREWTMLERLIWTRDRLDDAIARIGAIVRGANVSSPPYDPAADLQSVVLQVYETWNNFVSDAHLDIPAVANEREAQNAIAALTRRLEELRQGQADQPQVGQGVDTAPPTRTEGASNSSQHPFQLQLREAEKQKLEDAKREEEQRKRTKPLYDAANSVLRILFSVVGPDKPVPSVSNDKAAELMCAVDELRTAMERAGNFGILGSLTKRMHWDEGVWLLDTIRRGTTPEAAADVLGLGDRWRLHDDAVRLMPWCVKLTSNEEPQPVDQNPPPADRPAPVPTESSKKADPIPTIACNVPRNVAPTQPASTAPAPSERQAATNATRAFLNRAMAVDQEQLQLAGGADSGNPEDCPYRRDWRPIVQQREAELKGLYAAALAEADRSGFTVLEVERRLRALQREVVALLLWPRDAPELSEDERRSRIATGCWSGGPVGDYLSTHSSRMFDAWQEVESLALRIEATAAPAPPEGTASGAAAGASAPPASKAGAARGIDVPLPEATIAEAKDKYAWLQKLSVVNTTIRELGTPLVVNRQEPPALVSKTKRSTERGEARMKLIAALTKHHKYADGGCLNLEPVGNNDLARMAKVAPSSASQFFDRELQG